MSSSRHAPETLRKRLGPYRRARMPFDLPSPHAPSRRHARHHLRATPDTCYWGYIDRDQPPCLTVDDGDMIAVEAITHHAGDAPDLLMDDGIRPLWSAIAETTEGRVCTS